MAQTPLAELTELVELDSQYATARDQLRKDIGRLLKKLRRERKLSLRKASTLLDCDWSNLRRCEQGTAFSPSIIKKVISRYPRIAIAGDGSTPVEGDDDDTEPTESELAVV